MNRRQFLGGLIIGFFGSQLFKQTILAQTEDELIDISWRVPREQVQTVRDELNFEGKITPDLTTIEDDRGLPLIYILIGLVTLSSLAKTLLDIYKEVEYGGVLIQRNNKGELEIQNNPALSSGTIIIDQGDDVKIVFEEKDKPQTIELIEALKPLLKKKK